VTQTQDATNSISQKAESKSVAVNASPNVAALNFSGGKCCDKGGVRQSSGAWSGALAGNRNESQQSNDLQQGAWQSRCGHRSDGGSQSTDQSQTATNSIDQTAKARSFALNASPNVAVLNTGSVDQSSNASSRAIAVNDNRATQSNTLGQTADQQQTGSHGGSCCNSCESRGTCGNACDERKCRRDECRPCHDRCNDSCGAERGCDA
jgi:hypothetical protein